jgi:hypothetical protein
LKGNRELFKGLWIDSSGYDFKKHPVINLSLTGGPENGSAVEENLRTELHEAAKDNSVDPNGPDFGKDSSPGDILRKLAGTLRRATGERVAVLIDEYDAPVRDVLDDTVRANENLAVLRSFYRSLKTLVDKDLTRAVLLTGAIKPVFENGFSGFNNYLDLTFDPEYNAICGFTPDEFLSCFGPYLPDLLDRLKSGGDMPAEADREALAKKIFDFYGGYSWDGENRVLNPGSVIEMLGSGELGTRGFNSITPSFLMKVLKREGKARDFRETVPVRKNTLNSTDIDNLNLDSILFHAGHLTIREKSKNGEYLLERPNEEIRRAWDEALLRFFPGTRPKKP